MTQEILDRANELRDDIKFAKDVIRYHSDFPQKDLQISKEGDDCGFLHEGEASDEITAFILDYYDGVLDKLEAEFAALGTEG